MISSYISFKVKKSVKPQIFPQVPLGLTVVPDLILVKQNEIALIGLDQSSDDKQMLGNISPFEFSMPVITFGTYQAFINAC